MRVLHMPQWIQPLIEYQRHGPKYKAAGKPGDRKGEGEGAEGVAAPAYPPPTINSSSTAMQATTMGTADMRAKRARRAMLQEEEEEGMAMQLMQMQQMPLQLLTLAMVRVQEAVGRLVLQYGEPAAAGQAVL